MSGPIDHKPLLHLMLQALETVANLQKVMGLLQSYRLVNQDNETARGVVAARGLELSHIGYQITLRAGLADGTPRDVLLEAHPIPALAEGPDLDRAIYAGACQYIGDVARFTGNLSRIRDPAVLQKTAELFVDWAELLTAQMKAACDATRR